MFERVRLDLNCLCLLFNIWTLRRWVNTADKDPDHTEFIFPLGEADNKQIVKQKNNKI